LEFADIIVCPSNFVRDSLSDTVAFDKPIHVIPFGSPDVSVSEAATHHLSIARSSLLGDAGRGHDRLRVLFAGSMSQRKGLADLFAAMKLMDPKRVELHVMGSPIAPIDFYRSQFPHFVYHSTRPNEKVLRLMRTMDVFCLPSIVEGRALVIQEAMSQGLPIIITPNTGGEDLVDVTHPFNFGRSVVESVDCEPMAQSTGDAKNEIPVAGDSPTEASVIGSRVEKIYGRGATGFLVPIRSPQTIAACISWCSDHRHEVIGMGNSAQDKSREYTWKSYGDRIVQAVQDSGRKNKLLGGDAGSGIR
jgi:glycosyltransferase involved in cell wall biosynthesis